MATDPVSGAGSSKAAGLPVTRSLTLPFAGSLIVALLVLIATVAGLLYSTALYPTEEMRLLKLPTDLFSLVVGLPLLLGSMWLARRGKLLGLLCWPGVLLYVLYIYLSYAIGVPFSVLFPVYTLLLPMSAYTLIGLVASIDAAAVRQRLAAAVPERVAGGILIVFAILFSLINLANVTAALNRPTVYYLLDYPVWIADFAVVAPAWLIGGVLLWQRKAFGYVAGAALLLLGCMMFVGVVFALALPALYAASPVDVTSIVFILVASLFCFVPLALFARGIVRSEHRT
jgi:hypothetical protein